MSGPFKHLEDVSIFLNVYSDVLRGVPMPYNVHEELAKDYPEIVSLAADLADTDSLAIGHEQDFSNVYDKVTQAIRSA